MLQLPDHLKKYIVDQEQLNYTPKEQAIWRYILRQLKHFLKDHAHESYLDGLQKTGITDEEIPKIKDISQHLEKFGWRALPVSGFIPPAAFMELQSLGILPIAAEIRSLDHLKYTPAPDIVHEAAGHAPFLAHPEFAAYLKKYSAVAKKAIVSKEDLDIYEAIRVLSDTKENPTSTPSQITEAEKNLALVVANNKTISEAAELGRMNWWTAEYGLIGQLENPKIFGAGLLSSVGESKSCLDPKVKKLPLTIDCLNYSYDITEQQPQLFVTPSFKHLETVLTQMSEGMAFKKGGVNGLLKAKMAATVNTVQLNSGIQISGILTDYQNQGDRVDFLKFTNATQISFEEMQLEGHGGEYHSTGFSSPFGMLIDSNTCPSEFSDEQWSEFGLEIGKKLVLNFKSGFHVEGVYYGRVVRNKKTLLLSLKEATVKKGEDIFFKPEWGTLDLALGSVVTSVFSGPADSKAYGQKNDFVVKKVESKKLTDHDQKINQVYTDIRHMRTNFNFESSALPSITSFYQKIKTLDPHDWLAVLEIYEILTLNKSMLSKEVGYDELVSLIRSDLKNKKEFLKSNGDSIDQGIELAGQP